MSLEKQVQADVITAMKTGNKFEVTTLRSLNAQIKDERIKLRPERELTDEDVVRVLLTAAKRRKEAIELYLQGGRDDLVEKEKNELTIVQRYLPEQLSEEKILEAIDQVIAQVNATSISDLGKVMGPAMGKLKGKADGKLVQGFVRQRLTQISA